MGSLEGKAGHAVNPDALENDNKMNMGVIEMTAVLKRLKKDEKGFTLIELLAVIVILGIIAAIAIPVISNIMNKSREKSDIATAQQIYDAARMYIATENNGDFKSKSINVVTELMAKNYLDSNLTLPSTKEKIKAGEVKFDTNGNLLYVGISANDETISDDEKYTPEKLKDGKSSSGGASNNNSNT